MRLALPKKGKTNYWGSFFLSGGTRNQRRAATGGDSVNSAGSATSTTPVTCSPVSRKTVTKSFSARRSRGPALLVVRA